LNPDLAQNLQYLHLVRFPVGKQSYWNIHLFTHKSHDISFTEFVKWILSFCSNIHTLKLDSIKQPKDLINDIVRLTKLKVLHIGNDNLIDPKEVTCVPYRTKTMLLTSSQIIRNCRQLEVLRVDAVYTPRDLAELEHFINLKEAHLYLMYNPVTEVLPILKRCTNLRRLTLRRLEWRLIPPSKELCDFIMELKHLTFLHIIYRGNSNCKHFQSLVAEVRAFFLPRRPNFKFYISCCNRLCSLFDKHRVPR
jgi:hypothetical protein